MMKKIILSLSAAALLFSCQDAIEIEQPSEFNFATAYQTVEDVQSGVIAVYGSANTNNGIAFTAQFTDESSLGNSGNQGSTTHRLQLNVNNGFAAGLFTGYNSTIRNANIFFTGAALVSPEGEAEEDAYDQALGEAHALRAYAYSQLLAYFSQDLRDPSSLAVAVFDFIPGVDDRLPRNTVQEVVDQINSDLNDAESLLNSAGTDYSVDFVSVEFIQALRARVAAYTGNYSLAESAANDVLDSFDLASEVQGEVDADTDEFVSFDFREVWEDVAGSATSNEVIFKFNNTLAVSPGRLGQVFNTNSSSVAGSPLYEVSRRLFNILEENEEDFGDIRRPIYVDDSSIISDDYDNDPNPRPNDILVVDKYPGDPSIPGLVGGYTNDQKVFRTVEMHFILAEAAVASGDLDEAGEQLKIIRDARYIDQQDAPDFDNATEAWDEILNERYIELAFEGHRYIDVKRLGALANQGFDRNETDCSLYPASECDISFTDFRARALPIPAIEVRGNPGITQNDGY